MEIALHYAVGTIENTRNRKCVDAFTNVKISSILDSLNDLGIVYQLPESILKGKVINFNLVIGKSGKVATRDTHMGTMLYYI